MTTCPASAIVVGVAGSAQILCALDWSAPEAPARQRPLPIVHTFLWPLLNMLIRPRRLGALDAGPQNAAEEILSIASDDANDEQTHSIARLAYNGGGYIPRL